MFNNRKSKEYKLFITKCGRNFFGQIARVGKIDDRDYQSKSWVYRILNNDNFVVFIIHLLLAFPRYFNFFYKMLYSLSVSKFWPTLYILQFYLESSEIILSFNRNFNYLITFLIHQILN